MSEGKVIHIRFNEDLGCPKLNEMRQRMEMCEWRRKMRLAKPDPDDISTWDWDALKQLDERFNKIVLP